MMELHPIALKIPPMSAEEYTTFREDISKNGLLSPITLFEGKILDGVHRARGCRELGIEPHYETYEGSDPLGFVLSKNLHRRSLTAAQRRELAKELVREHPEKSDGSIARETRAHPNIVAAVRAEVAEEQANIHDVYNHDGEDEAPASEPAPAPPPRIERGLKKDGAPRQARGRKPGIAAMLKEPPKPETSVVLPDAAETLKRYPPPEPHDPPEQNQWVELTNKIFNDDVDAMLHTIITVIGYHQDQIQARVGEVSRRWLVGQFARSLGLKLAE